MTINELLLEQYRKEVQNSILYRVIENHFTVKGLNNLGAFFKKQSDDEFMHSRIILDFLNKRNLPLPLLAFTPPQVLFVSTQSILTGVLSLEQNTTLSLSQLQHQALSEGNYLVFEALSPLLQEQIEEEEVAQSILDRFNLLTTNQEHELDIWVGTTYI